jgi:putative peptidoglycan lipid II flippase
MFPQVIVLALAGIAMGVLNAYDHFSLPAIAPIVWNLIIILGLVVFSSIVGYQSATGGVKDSGFKILAWATFAGTVVQLAMQAPAVWKRRWKESGPRLRIDFRDPALREMLVILGPVMISLGIINFNALVDTQFASFLGQAAPAYIDKAFRLFQLPQGVFAIAIGTVLFPALSRHAIGERFAEFREDLSLGMRQILFLTLPFAALFVVLALPTVRLIYEHGSQVDSEQIASVATALTFFSIGMAFVSVNTLLNRAFYSLRKSWLPLLMGVVNLALNAVFDLILYKPLGVGGITLSTSLVSIFNFCGLLALLTPRVGGIDGRRVFRSAVCSVAALAPLAGVAYGVWWGLDLALGRSLLAQLVSVGAAYVAGGLAYCFAAWLMRLPELRDVAGAMRRRREPRATDEVIESEGGS